ncbi:MAG: hypothetical protein AB7T63_12530 [Planctomycetota bacterium]
MRQDSPTPLPDVHVPGPRGSTSRMLHVVLVAALATTGPLLAAPGVAGADEPPAGEPPVGAPAEPEEAKAQPPGPPEPDTPAEPAPAPAAEPAAAPPPAPVVRRDFPAPPPPRGVRPVRVGGPRIPPARPTRPARGPVLPLPATVPAQPGAPVPVTLEDAASEHVASPAPARLPGTQPSAPERPGPPQQPDESARPAPPPGPGEIPDPWALDPSTEPLDVPFPEVPGGRAAEPGAPLPPPEPPPAPGDDPFWRQGPAADVPDVPLLEGVKPSLPSVAGIEPPPADGAVSTPPGAEAEAVGDGTLAPPAAGDTPAGASVGPGADELPAAPPVDGAAAPDGPIDWSARYPDVGLELPPPGDFPRLAGSPEPAFPAPADVAPPGSSSPDSWLPGAPDMGDPLAAPGSGAAGETWMPGAPEQGPGPATTSPAPPTGSDPWGFGPGATPGGTSPGGATPGGGAPPAEPTAPHDPAPYDPWGAPAPGSAPPQAPRAPAAPDDPWGNPLPGSGTGDVPAGSAEPLPGGTAPGVPPYVGTTPAERAREHALRLRDRPGDPSLVGYPADLLLRADPRLALRPGARAAVVAFVDDADRASDLAAASLLSTLVGYRDRFDFVVVEARPRGPDDAALDALRRAYLRDVPTLVVLPPDRRAPRLFTRSIDAAEVELELVKALRLPPADPDDAGAAPTPSPGEYRDPSTLGGDGWAPTGDTTPPPSGLGLALDAHVQRLRQVAGDARVPGYPPSLVRTSDARVVREPGQRPLVILFYDDSSKASDLQAADFLPVLVERARDIDVVAVDVSVRARWDTFQKQVVHTYYMSFVPTTVVLTARRVPVKSWYQRVAGEQLQQAIDDALRRR